MYYGVNCPLIIIIMVDSYKAHIPSNKMFVALF